MISIDVIQRAKIKLLEQNVPGPFSIYLSPLAHEQLLSEVNKIEGKKHVRIFTILDMEVVIDSLCPPRGAYITGRNKNEVPR